MMTTAQNSPPPPEKPIEPPVIDLEAEDIERSDSDAADAPREEPGASDAGTKPAVVWPTMVWRYGLVALAVAAIAALAWFGGFAGGSGQSDAMGPRLDAIETANRQTAMQIGELSAMMQKLASEVAAIQPPDARVLEDMQARLGTLEEGAERIDKTIEELRAASAAGKDPAEQAAAEIAKLNSRVDELQAKLAGIEAAQPRPSEELEPDKAKLAAALLALRQALVSGRPFAAELDAVVQLMPDAAPSDDLKAGASTGVAALPLITERLEAITARLRQPAEPPPAEAAPTWWSTLRSKLASVIKVRRLEDALWTEATASALQDLKDGRPQDALQRLQSVPAAPPAEIAAVIADLGARVAADQAMDKIAAAAVQALGTAP